MTAEGATSQFQFDKRRAGAIVTLTTGGTIQGEFFIAGDITRHEGPERVGEMLNADPGFVPFEMHDGAGARTVLLNRAHVVTVALADDEASRDPGYSVAPRRTVRMLLSTGAELSGAVRVYRPEGRDRLSDWTRQPEAFRYLETSTGTVLVNMAHIVDIFEVSAS